MVATAPICGTFGELVQIADRIADPELSLQAHHSAWATWIRGGEFVRSQDHVRQGIALYDPDKRSFRQGRDRARLMIFDTCLTPARRATTGAKAST
jgi:hypothetical protein